MHTTGRLDRGDGVELAWARQDGKSPTVVFLSGFHSDMTGEKATALAAFCAERGQAMLRFDYSGHGTSSGRFEDGTISRWTDDALAMIDRQTDGPLILVGSSMGGWIALLAALVRPGRVAALVGIAAAPDFTEALMWPAMTLEQRDTLERDGVVHRPSQYGEPTPITRALIEDGRARLVLTGRIQLDCPVRLLHGQNDPDVPWRMALRIAERVSSNDVQVILVKDGDHRLSRPQDLSLLCRTLAALLSQDGT
jgi:pimeloyl-ACP methyl ester carboxylesterase